MFYFVWPNSRLFAPLVDPKELPADCRRSYICLSGLNSTLNRKRHLGLLRVMSKFCLFYVFITAVTHLLKYCLSYHKILRSAKTSDVSNSFNLLLKLNFLLLLGSNVLLIIPAECPSLHFGFLVSPVSSSSADASSPRVKWSIFLIYLVYFLERPQPFAFSLLPVCRSLLKISL